jgi:hypothetical protein
MNELLRVIDDPRFKTFKEIDSATGQTKGVAFRAFKRLSPTWTEGTDYVCCDSRIDAEAFNLLRARGRLYAGTVNAVLISADAQRDLLGEHVSR